MMIGQRVQKNTHTRRSKLGHEHTYFRNETIVIFRCDECDNIFERSRSRMDPNRLSNNYFHVCSNCDAKRFAQKRSINKKTIWNLRASSSINIGKL